MKVFLCILFISCFHLSCIQENNDLGYELRIHLEGDYDGHMLLALEEGYDSVKVVNGEAVFNGKVDFPEQYGVLLETPSRPMWVFLENSNIDMYGTYVPVTGETPHKFVVDSIVGSKNEVILQKWFKGIRKVYADEENERSTSTRIYKLIDEILAESRHVGSWALSRMTDDLSKEQVFELFEKLGEEGISPVEVRRIKKGIERSALMDGPFDWSVYNLIGLQDSTTIDLALNGIGPQKKLIHFWATWCSPCIKQMPYLDSLAEAHSNLSLLSFSIDSDHQRWEVYLEKNEKWKHEYLLEDGWDNPLIKRLRIDAIPYYMILDSADSIVYDGGLGNVERLLN